jgi:hypothetical protein
VRGDLDERGARDPSWRDPAGPFRFRGRNGLRACGQSCVSSSLVTNFYDVATKRGP